MGGKEFILQRNKNSSSEVTAISNEKLDRVLNKTGQISMVQCFKLQVECKCLSIDSVENERKELPHSLQQILSSFEDVFVDPRGLPPQRIHDHIVFL